jgi:hypothetical protein
LREQEERARGVGVARSAFLGLRSGEDDTPEATFDFALGASGEPSSPHFDDLTPAWLDAAHVKLPFRRADVDVRITERADLKAGRLRSQSPGRDALDPSAPIVSS